MFLQHTSLNATGPHKVIHKSTCRLVFRGCLTTWPWLLSLSLLGWLKTVNGMSVTILQLLTSIRWTWTRKSPFFARLMFSSISWICSITQSTISALFSKISGLNFSFSQAWNTNEISGLNFSFSHAGLKHKWDFRTKLFIQPCRPETTNEISGLHFSFSQAWNTNKIEL